ncbi:MAG: sensor histidine kinase [Bryobacteraceae bacterium]
MMRNYFRLARAEQDLAQRTGRVPVSSAEAITGELERERARLGHELHAGVGQALAGIKIHLEIVDSLLPDPPPAVRTSLHRIGLLAQEALQQLRSVAQRIHPPDWQRLSLAAALESLWNVTGIPDKYEGTLDVQIAADPPHAAKVLLYRAAQEALVNIVRHAGATRVRMSVVQTHNQVRLTVEDNGKGFDQAIMDRATGIGIRSLRTQSELLNGNFELRSGAQGTTLILSLPLTIRQ